MLDFFLLYRTVLKIDWFSGIISKLPYLFRQPSYLSFVHILQVLHYGLQGCTNVFMLKFTAIMLCCGSKGLFSSWMFCLSICFIKNIGLSFYESFNFSFYKELLLCPRWGKHLSWSAHWTINLILLTGSPIKGLCFIENKKNIF